MDEYDCVVVGLGGHGSSIVANLSNRGLNIVGLDQFSKRHPYGSSHGKSRIFRSAYFENPKYVPLLRRSMQLWLDLSARQSTNHTTNSLPLFNLCGGMMIGKINSYLVTGTLNSIRQHGLEHQFLNADQIRAKYPQLNPAPDDVGVMETNAGVLNPEACIEAYLNMATENGAKLCFEEGMTSWVAHQCEDNDHTTSSEDYIIVTTSKGRKLRTRKLVLSVGAWAPQVYGDCLPLAVKLHVERRVVLWLKPDDTTGSLQATNGKEDKEDFSHMPVYIWDAYDESESKLGELEDKMKSKPKDWIGRDTFYGFPSEVEPGREGFVKVAFHCYTTNQPVDYYDVNTPYEVRNVVTNEEVEKMRSVLMHRIPRLSSAPLVDQTTCFYTMTPDNHFLIDSHPKNKNIFLVSPCSGHGFKLCSVIGEIVGDLVVLGETQHDISLFRLSSRVMRG